MLLRQTSRVFSITRHGQLTDGVYTYYTVSKEKHVVGGVSGRSIFYSTINAEEAVLKATQYAQKYGLGFELYTRANTSLSTPLLNQIENGSIILKTIPK